MERRRGRQALPFRSSLRKPHFRGNHWNSSGCAQAALAVSVHHGGAVQITDSAVTSAVNDAVAAQGVKIGSPAPIALEVVATTLPHAYSVQARIAKPVVDLLTGIAGYASTALRSAGGLHDANGAYVTAADRRIASGLGAEYAAANGCTAPAPSPKPIWINPPP